MMYFLKVSVFDHPFLDTVPEEPEVLPLKRSSLILVPLKTKYGGIELPNALPQPINVVIDLMDVIA